MELLAVFIVVRLALQALFFDGAKMFCLSLLLIVLCFGVFSALLVRLALIRSCGGLQCCGLLLALGWLVFGGLRLLGVALGHIGENLICEIGQFHGFLWILVFFLAVAIALKVLNQIWRKFKSFSLFGSQHDDL